MLSSARRVIFSYASPSTTYKLRLLQLIRLYQMANKTLILAQGVARILDWFIEQLPLSRLIKLKFYNKKCQVLLFKDKRSKKKIITSL